MCWNTHWEENHGHRQRHGGQDGKTHDQKHHVKAVDLRVSVQELGFNGLCGIKQSLDLL